MTSKLTSAIDAWEQTARSITDLCTTLHDTDWNRPTDCPGWSVRDCVSHIIGVELELLGETPPWHQLPRDLAHVHNDFQRYMEVPVDLRRCHTPPEMVAELHEVVKRRLTMLRADLRGPDDEIRGIMGRKLPYLKVLVIRVFDTWSHEQDIRRAVGSPDNLDGPAAEISRDRILGELPRVVAKEAKAPAGSTVLFEVSGPISFARAVRVNEQGRGSLLGPADDPPEAPTVTLAMDWETFIRLACGRVRPDVADVKTEGDERLTRRVLEEMAVTP